MRILSLFFICFSFVGFSQNIQSFYNSQLDYPYQDAWKKWIGGDKAAKINTGKFVVYFDTARKHKALAGELKEGKRSGKWIQYHSNGKVKSIIPYTDGLKNGKEIAFNFQGDTMCILGHKNGLQHGLHKYYGYRLYDNKKYVSRVTVFNENKQVGKEYSFDENSDTLSVTTVYPDRDSTVSVDYTQGMPWYWRVWSSGNQLTTKYADLKKQKPAKVLGLSIPLGNDLKYFRSVASSLGFFDSLTMYPNLHELRIHFVNVSADDMKLLEGALKVLPKLKKLERIILTGWPPELPSEIFKCTQLKELRFNFPEVIPDLKKLSSMKSLKSVYIWSGQLKNQNQADKFFKEISIVRNLTFLSVSLADSADLPASVGQLSNLRFLSVGGGSGCNYLFGKKNFTKKILLLKKLRYLEVCADVYYNMNEFNFAAVMPWCQLMAIETCFPKETMIQMSDGTEKPISELRTGDIVWSYDFVKGKKDTSLVTKTFIHPAPVKNLCVLQTESNSGPLICTDNHPIYVKDIGFVEAGKIFAGQSGALSNSKNANFTFTTFRSSAGVVSVYNIETTKHNYFANGILVHNK